MEENKQAEKTAIVFDTNFIKSYNKSLKEVVGFFREKGYEVYIPQIVIDERIYQTCREEYKKFNDIEYFRKKYENYFRTYECKQTYEDVEKKLKYSMQKQYCDIFSNMIIPYNITEEIFKTTLERAYKKTPPFADGESDRGFKDTLIWLSIIDYFKDIEVSNIILLTDDKGYGKNHEYLKQEFIEKTNKTINIEDKSFYTNLLKEEQIETTMHDKEISKETLNKLRDEIQDCIYELCNYQNTTGDYFYHDTTFSINEQVDENYMEKVFNKLESNLSKHQLDKYIKVSDAIENDGRIYEEISMPIDYFEKLQDLYNNIKQNYPSLLQQFYGVVAKLINQYCYIEPKRTSQYTISDDEVPF